MGPFLFWVELDWSQQQQAAVFSQVPLVPVPPGFCHPWCRDTFALHALEQHPPPHPEGCFLSAELQTAWFIPRK